MSELTCLELSVALWLFHVLVQATVGNIELPFGYLFTSRDMPAAARGLLFGRATRALANYVENLTPFVAVALALMVAQRTGGSGALGATIWILARIVYIPIYLALFGPRLLAAPWHELVWQGLYQGVLTGVVSLALFGRAVALLGASAAGAFIALGPVIAALLAIPVLDEWPTTEDWIGIAVISVGVYLASGGPLSRRLSERVA